MKPTDKSHLTNPHAATPAERLRGVLLPFPTPFDDDEQFDARALRANIERWNRAGVAGYVALGSTGERVHLDDREYTEVVEAAREAVPRELLMLAGAGQHSTRASVRETQQAARAGADAVLLIAPHFYRSAMTTDALFRHYEQVADASPVPVVVYHIPQNTGVALAPELVARLAAHPNVVGVKDSSGDLLNLNETLRLVSETPQLPPEKFAVLTGHGGIFYHALAAGARGGILAVACAAPRLALAIQRAFERGEHARALEMQRRLAPLAKAVTVRFGVGGLKAALDLAGYVGGRVRAPLAMPGEEARRELARLLEAAEPTPEEEKAFLNQTEETMSAQR
ncbi:MAG TPA: dihydrodipicolinate synthase family protein [Pyrinomonadaceae bacterium]|nr:dihydrodipicolinate synthase family protein [Pyrinomonadaceae bacterium]